MRYLLGILVLFFLGGVGELEAQSQARIQLSATNNGVKQLEDLMKSLKNACDFRLQRQMNNVADVCKLSESQIRKLDVASNGAVSAFIKEEKRKHVERLKEYQAHAGFEFDLDGNTIEPEQTEDIIQINFLLKATLPQKIDDSKIWSKAFKQTLSDEQFKTFQTELNRRETLHRQAAVKHFLAQVDALLYLNPDQINKLEPIIDEKAGKLLLRHFRISDLIRNRGLSLRESRDEETGWRELLQDVLTGEQLDEWENSIEPKLFQMETDVMTIR